MKRNPHLSLIVLALAAGIFLSCNRNGKGTEDQEKTVVTEDTARGDVASDPDFDPDELEVKHAACLYYDFDRVKDLGLFFDSIAGKHGIPVRYEENEEEIRDCIGRIGRYRRGEAKFYPDSAVQQAIGILSLECAYLNNHAIPLDMTYAEWFLMCAAYYAPDISYIVDMQSPDHRAGALNLGQTYNDNPWWAYFICKRSKGYEVKFLGDDTKVTSLFQLQDEQNRKYYLCSNNDSRLTFLQQLFFAKGDNEIILAVSATDEPSSEGVDFDTYYFNEEQRAYYFCTWSKDYTQKTKVGDTPCLVLELDGEASRFSDGFGIEAEHVRN